MPAFRDFITVQANSPSQSIRGEEMDNWANVFVDVACEVAPLSSREVYQAQALSTEVSYRVKCRYLPITTTHRVSYDGAFWRIVGEPRNLDGRKRDMEFLIARWAA